MISIIIRAYNNEKYIEKSVESALNQNYNDYEIIVVNDGSTDKTKNIIEKFKDDEIKLINQENKGMIEAGYVGLKNSKGNHFVFLDGDDELVTNALSKLNDAIKDYDFAYSDYYQIENSNKKIVKINNIFDNIACGTLFKKSTIERIGFWNRNLIFPEYDLLIRLKKLGYTGVHIKKPLYKYRKHKDALTSNKELVEKGKKEIIEKHGLDLL